jgi:O-antigen ligase
LEQLQDNPSVISSDDTETIGLGEQVSRSCVRVDLARDCVLRGQSLLSVPSHAVARLWLIDLAGTLYAISLHKFAAPDGPATRAGGLIEAAAMTGAFLCVLFATRQTPRRYGPSLAVICFAVVCFLALVSSWRSFSPSVSAVKGVLSLLVLATCYLVSQSAVDQRYLRSIYRSYVVLLVLGLLAGMLPPHMYPLSSVDEYSGRTTFSVFYTFFGVLGEDTALLVLIAPLIFEKPRWVSGAFLVAMNVMAGGKTPTALLFAMLAIRFLAGMRKRPWWRIGLVFTMTCFAAFAVLYLFAFDPAKHHASSPVEAIYGNQVSENAMSFDGRTDLWKKAVELLPTVPVLGYGFEGDRDLMLKVASWSGSAHNSYLEIALSSGLIGFVFFVVGTFSVMLASLKASANVRLPLLLLLAFLAIQSFVGILFYNPSFIGLLILAWCSYRAQRVLVIQA